MKMQRKYRKNINIEIKPINNYYLLNNNPTNG